ncbi:hypothetical protein [Bremerella cremea]|uniref:hypothetical protein n=1 Tax=Bremerella cremea TaxID=1031537 RepID=UPI0011C022D1|nr:hypothetical protein [Bremerella cremea]
MSGLFFVSGQQELEQKAQAATVRRAGVQAVEACSASTHSALQTGTACEDHGAEAEVTHADLLFHDSSTGGVSEGGYS